MSIIPKEEKRVCMNIPQQECQEKPKQKCQKTPKKHCRKVIYSSRYQI